VTPVFDWSRIIEGLRASLRASLANPPSFTHNPRIGAWGGFMSAVRSSKVQLGWMVATLFAVSMWPAASQAYTPEQQQACSDDAFRLCSAEIPDVDRVTVCMVRNKAQLSPGCRVYFRPDPEVAPVAATRPLSIKPASSHKPVSAKSRKTKKPKPDAT
jgi:hypothetical protein